MAIAELLSRLTGKSIYSFDVDVHRDRIEIFHMLFLNVKENSLAALYPDIASQWHSIRNGQLRPEDITESMVEQKYLETRFMPDPELLIRTGGELRVSNYLLGR